MKVLIAAASFSSELSGVQRHAFNLARCLLAHPAISSIVVVVAPWQQELIQKSGLETGPRLSVHIAQMNSDSFNRNLWYYRELPLLAPQLRADVVHLTYPVPVNGPAFSCPTVVTLHDLYPYQIPSNFGFLKGLFNRLVLRQCLHNVSAIACVSDFTCRQLRRFLPRSVRKKALCIYNCVEPEPQCATHSPIGNWKGGPFLLCVAQHRRNKNIPFLLRVFHRLIRSGPIDPSTQLVIVGIAGPESRLIRRTIVHSGLIRNIRLMEGLSDADLQWCYRNCDALLAPSTIEGFGLPVVEALLAGCRVVCSDIPAFREFGGDHCRYVPLDRHAEDAFIDAVVAALAEARRGPIAMPQLSGPSIAGQYVQLYSRLLGSKLVASAGFAQSSPIPAASAPETERQFL
jgi:glycosyltransferase involved in cell wall biosynthesis